MRYRNTTETSCGAGEPRLYAVAMLVMLATSLAWLGQTPATAGDDAGHDSRSATVLTVTAPAG